MWCQDSIVPPKKTQHNTAQLKPSNVRLQGQFPKRNKANYLSFHFQSKNSSLSFSKFSSQSINENNTRKRSVFNEINCGCGWRVLFLVRIVLYELRCVCVSMVTTMSTIKIRCTAVFSSYRVCFVHCIESLMCSVP